MHEPLEIGSWQTVLDTALEDAEKQNLLADFKKLRSDQERVAFCNGGKYIDNVKWINDYLDCIRKGPSDRKSAQISTKLREDGNKAFRDKHNRRALENYTKSILFAPFDPAYETKELALGYANRSAALYDIGQYQLCLDDIEQAFHHGYPDHLHYKLQQRRANSYVKLKKFASAKKEFEFAIKSVQDCDKYDKQKKDELIKKLSEAAGKIKQDGDLSVEAKLESFKIPSVSHGDNNVVVQATAAVDLKNDTEQGRHLLANSDLSAGDVLIVEKPFAAVLLPSHYESHCHHCFAEVLAPRPCHNCTKVRYCSDACRQASWDTYHFIECPYLDLLHSVGIAHLGLRVVLVAGLQFLLGFRGRPEEDDNSRIAGVGQDGCYRKSYLSVYDLMPHTENMATPDLFQYTLTATLLLRCLLNAGYFPEADANTKEQNLDIPEDVPCTTNSTSPDTSKTENLAQGLSTISDDVESSLTSGMSGVKVTTKVTKVDILYIGGLICRHIQQLVCNAHAITEVKVDDQGQGPETSVDSASQVRVATAIYPTASLMNHSCDPSIISSFHKDVLVVRAVKDLKAGDQVYNCYGPHHKRMERGERQELLSGQYFFTCLCRPCMEDGEKEQLAQALKCPKCEGPVGPPGVQMTCSECGHVLNGIDEMKTVLASHNNLIEGLKHMENNQLDEAYELLLDCYKKRKSVMHRYNKDLAEAADQMARCCAMQRNFAEAAKYLSESVAITKVRYGESSIELAHEYQKLAEVLFNCKEVDLTLQFIEKAMRIFRTSYGDAHSAVLQLQEMKDCLNQYLMHKK